MPAQSYSLTLDRSMVRAYLAALYEPGDILQFEGYPKPNPGPGPTRRLSFAAGELNERVLDQIEQLNNPPTYANWYVRTNPLQRIMPAQSAKDADVGLIRHLWLDLDNADAEQVTQRIAAAGWPAAAVIVASGGVMRGGLGAQLFFKLKTPIPLPAGDAAAGPMLGYVRNTVRAMLLALRDDPSTINPSRLMRVAGTWNVKHPKQHEPRLARLVYAEAEEGERWTLEQWAAALGVKWDPAARVQAPAAPREHAAREEPEGATEPLPVLPPILAGCAWLKHCREDGAKLPEPEWYAALSIVARCQDGRAEAHKLSADYSGYQAAETDAKIDQALSAAGPRTCTQIESTLGQAALCGACRHHGQITSPIELGHRRRRKASEATALACRASILQRAGEQGADAVVTAALEDPDEMEQLAWLSRHNPGQLQALLDRLCQEHKLKQRRADDLAKTVANIGESQARREKAARYRQAERVDRVLDVFKGAPVGEHIVVPPGWNLSGSGILVEDRGRHGEVYDKFVTCTPLLVTAVIVDVDLGTYALQITAHVRGLWKRFVLPRKTLAVAQEIVAALATYGLDVHTGNKLEVVRWLAAYEAVNAAQIPYVESTSSMGWHAGDRFLIGRQVIGPDGVQALAGDDPREWKPGTLIFRPREEGGDVALLDAFHTAGTLQGWLAAIAPLAEFPQAAVGIYVALAAPLLHWLREDPLIVEWADRTSTGKTTALKVAASTCGNPYERARDSAIHSWSSTPNAVCRMAAMLRHLPLFLDDTRKSKPETLINVIYDFSGGHEKDRMNKDGEMQRAGSWETVLLSTGEQKLTDFAAEQEGGHVRVLSMWGRPFGEKTERTGHVVDRLNLEIERHYGHAMPAMIGYVLAHRDQLPKWKEQLEDTRQAFAAEIREAGVQAEHLAHRMAALLGCLQLVVRLTHEALPLPWEPIDLWSVLRTAVLEGISGADSARFALQVLIEDAALRREQYYDGGSGVGGGARPPPGGWRGRWDEAPTTPICFATQTVREVLERYGIVMARVVRVWADNGWIRKDGEERNSVTVQVGQGKVRCLVVLRAAVDLIVGSTEDAEASDQFVARAPRFFSGSPPPAGGRT